PAASRSTGSPAARSSSAGATGTRSGCCSSWAVCRRWTRLAEPRFGIGFQTDKTPAQYAALARLVDRYEFDVVSAYNDLMYQPAIGPLMLMAPHLGRAQIGPAVTNPFIVHPVEIAGQVAVLDAATNGRAYLGLGRGA